MDLCVTADDYGLSGAVNAAIEELAGVDAVQAVSVMTHEGAELDGALDLRRTGVATGLHLVFTHERPLSPALRQSPLVGADGRLPRSWPGLFARLMARPSLAPLFAGEVEAQLQRFLALGLRLDFINGHEHAHLFPPLWPAVARVARRTGAAVRVFEGRPRALPDRLLHLSSRACLSLDPLPGATVLRPLGIARSGRLTLADVDRLLGSSAPVPARRGAIAELIVHPANEDRPRGGGPRDARRHERAMLASTAFRDLLRAHGATRTTGIVSTREAA